jgi:hypothetical protein
MLEKLFNYKKNQLIFLIIFTSVLPNEFNKAQSLLLGFGFENSGIFLDSFRDEFNYSLNAGVHIGIKLIEELEAEIRLSYSPPFDQPFAGAELGLFLRFFPFDENVYFILGDKLHWNQGRTIGRYDGYNSGLFNLLGLGVGFNYKKLYMDIAYYIPFRRDLRSYLGPPFFTPKKIDDFNSVISLNISFSWKILLED